MEFSMVNEKLLQIAFNEYGNQEWVGITHNPSIIKYFHEIGHEWVDDDEMAWCSAFVNWVAMKANYYYNSKLNARSWLDEGLEILYPELGDIVILWRINKSSIYGHVGFYINSDKNYVWILGGNQSNQVSISKYPKSQVLGYRRLVEILNKENND